jgi:AcrR family transcriptional regulator
VVPRTAGLPTRPLRRDPQQARSRARVQAILDAADRILAAEGVEALTMRRIVDDAGVPTGTIYQFFADKGAVLSAVAQRYLDLFVRTMSELEQEAAAANGEDMLDRVLDTYIDLYRDHPGYVAIWSGRHLSRELMAEDDANNDALAEGLRRILLTQGQVRDQPELAITCRAIVQVVDALLQLAFRTDPSGDQALLGEARRIARLYTDDLTARFA